MAPDAVGTDAVEAERVDVALELFVQPVRNWYRAVPRRSHFFDRLAQGWPIVEAVLAGNHVLGVVQSESVG